MSAVNLSLIIPTYNRPQLVGGAVASALVGGVGGVEVIVVDDGSKDDAAQHVVAGFGCNARYLRQANAGLPAARNAGAAASQGRYLAFLDDDDVWLPGGAARLLAALERHPEVGFVFADAVGGNPQEGYRSLTQLRIGSESFDQFPGRELEPGLRLLERGPFFRACVAKTLITTGTFVVRRDVFESVGRYNPVVRPMEDWEFYLRLTGRHEVAFLGGGPVARILGHPGTMSTDAPKMRRGLVGAMRQALLNGRYDEANRRALREAFGLRLFSLAYDTYEAGDFRAARGLFGEYCRRFGPLPRATAYWLLTFPPAAPARRLRDWLQARSRQKETPPS